MKAVYEFDAPKTCSGCRLSMDNGRDVYCLAQDVGKKPLDNIMFARAHNCPLKIVEPPSPKLKPCPFCGCRGEEEQAKDEDGYLKSDFAVSCKGCYARTGWSSLKEHAIAAWNRREG